MKRNTLASQGATMGLLLPTISRLNKLPGNTLIKDSAGRYLVGNDRLARVLGWRSARDLEGKSDYDIPGTAQERAESYITDDRLILASKIAKEFIGFFDFGDETKRLLFCRKQPYHLDGGLVGLSVHSCEVSPQLFRQVVERVGGLDLNFPIELKETPYNNPLSLSDRQLECLCLFLRGRTAREIAEILELSVRTIEKYLESLKNRLCVESRSELFDAAYDLNYQYIVPRSLML